MKYLSMMFDSERAALKTKGAYSYLGIIKRNFIYLTPTLTLMRLLLCGLQSP